jgi:predicted transcriptional regulator
VLSEPDRELLKVIAQTKPQSLQSLADKTGRAKSNLSRTLRTMERHGPVHFEKGKGRTLMPRTLYTHLALDAGHARAEAHVGSGKGPGRW